ncbi:hypothetical protein [Arthrobacter sp. zg-Y1110]|uniref:hypothetical protein n=1 Tax=Arthrobacter sp. zg-Y1110 TaxID=2886932 RepID=UPI001D1508A7|nr:hypothetical protein [Arthrobacter sp. zg-Y1110]MCC3291268.1 hypothetical protein [Arthrobacter sp. zg-Y1110]UWX83694.1 hypothetical protein N2K99_09195 [Arthrobacter sp. zg-Y1110]
MDDEIELISDGEGLAVIGTRRAVERFLDAAGLLSLSKDLGLHRLGSLLHAGAGVAEAAFEVAANSGLYLKLTKESAKLVRESGLMETATPGISHVMLGKPGSISKWIQVENGPGSLLTNPALLSGTAGIMAQFARQQEMNEFKVYLDRIDTKIDNVLSNQRYEKVADVKGAGRDIESAMRVLEKLNRADDDTWSTVQGRQATITNAQEWALLQLAALANRIESTTKIGDLAKSANDAASEVRELLAVVARCFELQDMLDFLRLERMLDASPADLDGLRLALKDDRQERREDILRITEELMTRMDAAAGTAKSNVLFHLPAHRAVVGSINHVGIAVDDFHGPLGIESDRDSLKATRWWDAAREAEQWKTAGAEAGRKALGVGVAAGVVLAVSAATNATKKS